MIQLTRPSLNIKASKRLTLYQDKVNLEPNFPLQVAFAKVDFPTKNVIGNATFDDVKLKLIEMCSGAERCHYCEDSKADEVEHLLPKDSYPDLCYVWSNYFYSCGSCNIKKGNKSAVVDAINNKIIDNTPPKKKKNVPTLSHTTPPISGQQAFINLETENPLVFFLLDIQTGSFEFSELPDEETIDFIRAKYTLETLKLNKRAFLRKARKQAYGDYKARLSEYILNRNLEAPQIQLNEMIEGIKNHCHPTVWKEMVRQRNFIPELQKLFDQAPEAIDW